MFKFRRIALISCLMILKMFAQGAEAADSSANETAKELIEAETGNENHPWKADGNMTWLPKSTIRDTNGKLGMLQAETSFDRSFSVNPKLNLSAGLAYSLIDLDAPASARLPGELHTLALNLGAEYKISDDLSLDARLAPGLNSDFKKIGGDDFRTQVGIIGRYNMSKKLTFLAGLIYQQGYKSIPVMPVIGAIYTPNEQWVLSLAAPRLGVTYNPDKKTSYYISGEFTDGEYQVHDASIGAKIINYQDMRALAGVERILFSSFKIYAAAGYAFNRKFVFYDGSRNDVHVDNNVFTRFGISMEW